MRCWPLSTAAPLPSQETADEVRRVAEMGQGLAMESMAPHPHGRRPMKRDQCGMSVEKLSDHDRSEVERFKTYLRTISAKKADGLSHEAAQRAAHAEVYGEVVFDSGDGR
jgi:hypothetical protein